MATPLARHVATGLGAHGFAISHRELAVDKDPRRTTGDVHALIGRIVHRLVLAGRRNGPRNARIPNADIRVSALRQTSLARP